MTAPCKDCPDRYVGRHGKCEKYKAYRAEWDAMKHKENLERETYDHIVSQVIKTLERMEKNKSGSSRHHSGRSSY